MLNWSKWGEERLASRDGGKSFGKGFVGGGPRYTPRNSPFSQMMNAVSEVQDFQQFIADAKRLHYYDLLNLLPPVRAFNEDDDEDNDLLGDYNHKHLLIVSTPERGRKNLRKFSSIDADW